MSDASENLRYNQKQLDADGCMVGVSRQAVEETLLELNQLREALEEIATNCDAHEPPWVDPEEGRIQTGLIAIKALGRKPLI